MNVWCNIYLQLSTSFCFHLPKTRASCLDKSNLDFESLLFERVLFKLWFVLRVLLKHTNCYSQIATSKALSPNGGDNALNCNCMRTWFDDNNTTRLEVEWNVNIFDKWKWLKLNTEFLGNLALKRFLFKVTKAVNKLQAWHVWFKIIF